MSEERIMVEMKGNFNKDCGDGKALNYGLISRLLSNWETWENGSGSGGGTAEGLRCSWWLMFKNIKRELQV